MDLSYLKKLIKLVETSGIGELELEEEGSKIRIAKPPHNSSPAPVHSLPVSTAFHQSPPVMPAAADPRISAAPEEPIKPPEPQANIHEVKSPIVGTFYRAPAPDADPYVQIGQIVDVGTVLCIVEAMKLMNEIESDIAGRIVKICVENGQPVEYNQTLFHIEKG
ncbi:MAG: acetyl-CoA carboxylase biotin carboxyl carrier protein [Bacteroidota bacterium]